MRTGITTAETGGGRFQNGQNDGRNGWGSFPRTARTTANTSGVYFVERPKRPPKWVRIVFENGHNDRRNGPGPFRRTAMTVSGRTVWKTGPAPFSGLSTNFPKTTPENDSGVVMDNALGGVAVGRYFSLIRDMKCYEMTP